MNKKDNLNTEEKTATWITPEQSRKNFLEIIVAGAKEGNHDYLLCLMKAFSENKYSNSTDREIIEEYFRGCIKVYLSDMAKKKSKNGKGKAISLRQKTTSIAKAMNVKELKKGGNLSKANAQVEVAKIIYKLYVDGEMQFQEVLSHLLEDMKKERSEYQYIDWTEVGGCSAENLDKIWEKYRDDIGTLIYYEK